jgi:hypothetical protein
MTSRNTPVRQKYQATNSCEVAKKLLSLLGQTSQGGNMRNPNACIFYEKIIICMDSKIKRTASFV